MTAVAASDRGAIATLLEEARRRTLALLEPLDDDTVERTPSPLQSPPVWDLAHVGHFEELWIPRRLGGFPPILSGGDDLYDAFRHERREREGLPLLRRRETLAYLAEVRARTLATLEGTEVRGPEPLLADGFVFGLVLQHELQHQETLLQTIQLTGLPHPGGGPGPVTADGESRVPAGEHVVGTDDEPWAYDNERPAHEVELGPFAIDRSPVTTAAFEGFVAAGGYRERRWWSDAGWAWREAEEAQAPLFWHEEGTLQRFGARLRRSPDEPVQHVCFHEAEAYASWAGKRLPSELEWEAAARRGLLAGRGEVWEWTSSAFAGYPGFRAFPYPQYSEVFFGDEYRVLRGASWATDPLVARLTFRNWDFPVRRQIFAGFRCARDA